MPPVGDPFGVLALVLAGALLAYTAYKRSEGWKPALAIALGFFLVLVPTVLPLRALGVLIWIHAGLTLLGATLIIAGLVWGWVKGVTPP